jgi:two-component system cell cycle response regulator CpdR
VGQSKPFSLVALVVEDDHSQRKMISFLLEDSDYVVIECSSAEAAEKVLRESGRQLSLLFTDVNLSGRMSGVELAFIARQYNPNLEIVVTSGKPLLHALPDGAKFWPKPWARLDLLREAAMVRQAATSP